MTTDNLFAPGERFGHMTVSTEGHLSPKGKRLWLCRNEINGKYYYRTAQRLLWLRRKAEEVPS